MNIEDKLKELQEKRQKLSDRRSSASRIYNGFLGVAVLLAIAVPFFAWRYRNSESSMLLFVYLYGLSPLAMLPMYRARVRALDEDLQELDFQIDLQQFEVSLGESRAEKILRLNSFQLKRYYDLTLQQNIWVFGLGIFCLLVGVGIIGLTLYLVGSVVQTVDAKIITSAVGVLGSVMTNYVAAIYLKMHASAATNLSTFHSRLVDTHQLLFGNLLASRIEDSQKRSDTLSTLAINISKHDGKKKEA